MKDFLILENLMLLNSVRTYCHLSVSIIGFVYLETAKWELACKTLGHALKVSANIKICGIFLIESNNLYFLTRFNVFPKQIQKKVLDDTNPLILNTMETLGYANIKFGRFDDALQVSTHQSCIKILLANDKQILILFILTQKGI